MNQELQNMVNSAELRDEDRHYIILSKIRFLNEQMFNHEVDSQLENVKEFSDPEAAALIEQRMNNCIAQKELLNSLLSQLVQQN